MRLRHERPTKLKRVCCYDVRRRERDRAEVTYYMLPKMRLRPRLARPIRTRTNGMQLMSVNFQNSIFYTSQRPTWSCNERSRWNIIW